MNIFLKIIEFSPFFGYCLWLALLPKSAKKFYKWFYLKVKKVKDSGYDKIDKQPLWSFRLGGIIFLSLILILMIYYHYYPRPLVPTHI